MEEVVLDTRGMTEEQIEVWVEIIGLANEYHVEIRYNEGVAIGLAVSALKGGWKNNIKVLASHFVIKPDPEVLKEKVNNWAKQKPIVIKLPTVYVEKKKKKKKKKGK